MDETFALFETCVVPAAYCDGAYSIEVDDNGVARLLFYVEQQATDGSRERVVACRLVMPKRALEKLVAHGLRAVCAQGAEGKQAVSAWPSAVGGNA